MGSRNKSFSQSRACISGTLWAAASVAAAYVRPPHPCLLQATRGCFRAVMAVIINQKMLCTA